jgi:hypothetical protein
MITEKSIKVYECSCSNCGAKFTVRDNDGVDHDFWLKKADLEDWLREGWLREGGGWFLRNGDWYCSDCIIVGDDDVPCINEARKQLTAKEKVLKVYPYAVARCMTWSGRWRIFNGDLEIPISHFFQTEQQSWESALAIINAKKEKK